MSVKNLLQLLRKQEIGEFLQQLPPTFDKLSASEIGSVGHALQKVYQTPASPDFRSTLQIAVLSDANVTEVCHHLRTTLAVDRIKADVLDTGFNQWRFELVKGMKTVDGYGPSMVVCLLDEYVIFEEIGFSGDLDIIADKLERENEEIEKLIEKFCETSSATLVLNTVLLSRPRAEVFVDFASRAKLSRLWHRFNERLLAIPEKFERVCVVDSTVLLQGSVPSWTFSDTRLSAAAKMHLSSDTLLGYAKEYAKIAKAVLGQSKKCLVTDLDNTIWGGILGDDGVDALEVEEGNFGNAFHQFQSVLAALGKQGVILAVNSKNESSNVQECFRRRRMPLAEESFAHIQANWSPKDQNLREIAATLNIGLDSMVFIDDSAFECDWVRQALPDVTVIHLDGSPAEFPSKVLSTGLFNRMRLTSEDHMRNTLYVMEAQRKKLRSSFDSIESYLGDLQLKVDLFDVRPEHVHRVAQLTQRTNQFNLTTIRLSDADVLNILQLPQKKALAFDVQDRFGSYGTVGCVFAHIEGREFHIDNFVMSCRVFSRGIEKAVLSRVCEVARRMECATIVGRYARTDKNRIFADFYPSNGFVQRESRDGSDYFVSDLENSPDLPPWISMESDVSHQIPLQEAL